MKAIVLYRFTDSGSELRMHTNWLANTAVEELIGPGALTGRSTLYSCLDRVIWNSDEWRKARANGIPCQRVADAIRSCIGHMMPERLEQAASGAFAEGLVTDEELKDIRRDIAYVG